MAFLPLAMMAYDTEVDGIYYNVVKKARVATVTSGDNPYSGEVVIPETIVFEGTECTVTGIDKMAFNGCSSLTSVTFPEGLTSIGDNAFNGCSGLTSVTFPEGLTSIGYKAFYNCYGLTNAPIPEGVTSIGAMAFWYCDLTSVTIPASVTSIDKWAFYYNSNLLSVTINSDAIMSKVPGYPYEENNLSEVFGHQVKELIIGEGVTSIAHHAFAKCTGLTSVTIPASLTSIGISAFGYCRSLINVQISDLTAWCNMSGDLGFASDEIHLYLNGEEIIGDLVIPEGVTSIGNSAFYRCLGLTSVTIPSSVTSIGDGAFGGCSGLTSMTISEGVTSISNSAFMGCRSLTSVIIPSSVTSIGGSAFSGCTGLTSVTISEGVTSIGDRAFWNCSSLTSVTIPSSVTSIGGNAFSNCENLEVVTCNATTVPSTNTNAFDGSYTEYATLIVPDEALSDYQTTAPWSNFGTILGSSQATVVTANSYTREYGEPNPTFEYTTGIPLNGEPSFTCSATEISAPGVYPIVITQGTETNAGLIYVNGTLTITKAPLTITAKSYTINEGDAMPTFEVEYDGFKNDETADDLTSQPTISCTATDTNTEGTYDITVSGAASDNYDISYVAGKLTVVPTDAHITITSAGMGTYCSPYDLDFTGVTALKAYTINGYDKASSRVYAMRVYDVPAGTGLYLVGNPGDYDVPISTSNSYYINMLVGTLEQTWIDTTDGDLTNLRLTGTNPSNASFKILSEGRNFSANRAYLQIPTYILGNTANAATAFGIVLDDDTNGIEDIMQSSDDTDSEWYTLDGRKLNGKPTARGIYVVKGRKVVIK